MYSMFVGTFRTDGDLYRLLPTDDGEHRVEQISQDEMPACDEPLPVGDLPDEAGDVTPEIAGDGTPVIRSSAAILGGYDNAIDEVLDVAGTDGGGHRRGLPDKRNVAVAVHTRNFGCAGLALS